MDNLIIGLIIALIAVPCYFGLKKIAAMFGSKDSCGCGKSDCGCSGNKNGLNKASKHQSSISSACSKDNKNSQGSIRL